MPRTSYVYKIIGAFVVFVVCSSVMSWRNFAEMSDNKADLQTQLVDLERKKAQLLEEITNLERNKHRSELQKDKLEIQVRDLHFLAKSRAFLPHIFFITPTKRRPAQKADLIRLSQTLSHVANLYWVVVEDAEQSSPVIDEILKKTQLNYVHLVAATPSDQKMKENDPNWMLPRGVTQRNTALDWLRTNFMHLKKGIVFFGDDDNVYDWSLFDDMRKINKVGVWPVGLVGGQLVETPIVKMGEVVDFNANWKKERPFPIDMAAFAVNVTIVLQNPEAKFSFDVPRGYQESHFLTGLNLNRSDLEPLADFCSNVLVYHTRTEKVKLSKIDFKRFSTSNLTTLELQTVV